MSALQVILNDDQLRTLAAYVAEELRGEQSDTISVAVAARRFDVSTTTIHRRVKAGLLRPIPNIGKTMFTEDEIQRFLNS